jgi:DNA-binding MarR family transcriptional regulator
MDSLKLDNQLCFPVYALSRHITGLYRPHLEKLGLTYPQYLVMLVLWQHTQVTVKELGSKLYLDSGTLTPLLKRMAENGLVTRSRAANDERLVNITITNKGQALKAAAEPIPAIIAGELALKETQYLQMLTQINSILKAKEV